MIPDPKRWLTLCVILAAECMDLLDGTIVNVAAPTIHRDLHTSSTALQWIVAGYPFALAVGLLGGARLGDVFGRRHLFLLGVGGFTAASAACGLAPSTGALIGSRLLQGTAGAMMLPQGLGVLRQVFAADELPRAFGLFGPVMGSAAIVGPIIGGGLIALHLFGSGWRLVFLVNVPIGLLTLVAASRLLPRGGERHAGSLDILGAAIAAGSSFALVYPLVQGRQLGWPAWSFALIAAGLGGFAVLALHLRRRVNAGRDPLVLPSIFAHRGYSAGALVVMLYFGGMVGAMLSLTLFLQLGERFSAIHAGLTLVPFALGTALSAPLAAQLAGRAAGRLLIQLGGAISIAGYASVSLILADTARVSTFGLAVPLLVVGIGMGLFIVPAFATILAAVSDLETGSASGALNALQQLGSGIGVAALGTVFFDALSHQGFAAALRRTMWWEVGGLALMLALTPLLPRKAHETTLLPPPAPIEATRV